MLISCTRKNIEVEEVTIDPEAKWTYTEKKEGPVKPDPEGLHNTCNIH